MLQESRSFFKFFYLKIGVIQIVHLFLTLQLTAADRSMIEYPKCVQIGKLGVCVCVCVW